MTLTNALEDLATASKQDGQTTVLNQIRTLLGGTLQTTTADVALRTEYDYYIPPSSDGLYQLRFSGTAPQGTATSANTWTIRRYTWTAFGGLMKVTEIQTIVGIWDNRAGLSWS